jgi:hypothetical protein
MKMSAKPVVGQATRQPAHAICRTRQLLVHGRCVFTCKLTAHIRYGQGNASRNAHMQKLSSLSPSRPLPAG